MKLKHQENVSNSSFDAGHQMDNSNSMIKRLSTLYLDSEFSDLQLHVGGKVFYTHRLILSIASDVFKTMLTSPKWPEAQLNCIYLQEETECTQVFGNFLHYLYSGRICMSHVTVLPILSLADKYNIGDLATLCIDFMCHNIVASPDASRVLSWYKYANMSGHQELERVCEEYITLNFQYLMATEDFLLMPPDVMLHFLTSSEIVVDSEYALFLGCSKWIEKRLAMDEESSLHEPECKRQKLVTCSALHKNQKEEMALYKTLLSTFKYTFMSGKEQRNILEYKNCKNIGHSSLEQPVPTTILEQHLSKKTTLKENTLCMHTRTEQKFSVPLFSYKDNTTSISNCQSLELFAMNAKEIELPRVYTCDSWCTEVIVQDLDLVNPGDMLGAFFSTPISGTESDDAPSWDWHLNFYPKGIAFKKCMLIGMMENKEIDEVVYERVRLTLTPNIQENCKVKVTVLVYGHQNGIEYVVKGITKKCIFDMDHTLFNINDIIPFSALGDSASPYRFGAERKGLKLAVIVRPT